MNHNEIEAYTNKVNIKNNFIVIWINDSMYHDRNKKRMINGLMIFVPFQKFQAFCFSLHYPN